MKPRRVAAPPAPAPTAQCITSWRIRPGRQPFAYDNAPIDPDAILRDLAARADTLAAVGLPARVRITEYENGQPAGLELFTMRPPVTP